MARAGLGRARTGLGWRGAAASSALMLAAVLTGVPAADAAQGGFGAPRGSSTATGSGAAKGDGRGAAGGATAACGKATGPFGVSGTQVFGVDGKAFVSYGLTVAGLQGPDWAGSVMDDLEEITAAADDWCANTVRLQLDQDDLLGPRGTGFDQSYLAAIETEVSLAESEHLVVVLNDETNYAPAAVAAYQLGPTPATKTFWKDLTKVYGYDPQVIFDLFNEPRMYSFGMSAAQEWRLWRDGGRYEGVNYPFGMAELAAYVRNTLGATNLFWIEGPDWSASFAGMVQAGALLNVSGVVYAVHHPAGQPDPASWNADFGYLVNTGVAPVVDGEWTNYEPTPTSQAPVGGSCWPDAPTMVPEFLQYLATHGIGLDAYTLQAGYLLESTNPAVPNTINARTWTCQPGQEAQPGQGAGAEIMSWFQQQNG